MELEAEVRDAQAITSQFDPAEIDELDKESIEQRVAEIKPKVASLSSDQAMSEVFGMATLHPSAHVRYYMLDVARENIVNVFTQRFVCEMTHDDEDFVAFEALRVCRDLNLQRSIDDLVAISGWPSERLTQGKKPVGVGHAVVMDAILSIFGTEEQEELEGLEEHYRENGHLPATHLDKPMLNSHAAAREEAENYKRSVPDGMVRIPGGTYTIGIEESDLPTTRFKNADFTTPYTVEVGPFYIDKYPVTMAEYRNFLDDIDGDEHKYCHPGEPKSKDHRPNTRFDDRIEDDHPVTGIDYYDAYAYAKWAGKDLPIEEEWEIAARGKSGNVFPWGDTFDPERLNWAGRAFDSDIEGLSDWRDAIETADRMAPNPETITTPVDTFPEGESEFGVVDMLGNVWEYTKTNFFSRQEMHPVFRHSTRKAHENLIENFEAFPVIRGGAWSSIPEMTSCVYRGKDLMTDRHNEIGFRCVKRISIE